MIFNQGDIVDVDFDPTRGHEPAKVRPALVVSSFDFNRATSMTIVCPITSNTKPFFLHEVLPQDCVVQARAIDLDARHAEYLGSLDHDALRPILICIQSFFKMDEVDEG